MSAKWRPFCLHLNVLPCRQLDPQDHIQVKFVQFFFQENAFEIVTCKLLAFLSGLNMLLNISFCGPIFEG